MSAMGSEAAIASDLVLNRRIRWLAGARSQQASERQTIYSRFGARTVAV